MGNGAAAAWIVHARGACGHPNPGGLVTRGLHLPQSRRHGVQGLPLRHSQGKAKPCNQVKATRSAYTWAARRPWLIAASSGNRCQTPKSSSSRSRSLSEELGGTGTCQRTTRCLICSFLAGRAVRRRSHAKPSLPTNLQAKMLIGVDILSPKGIILDVHAGRATIRCCDDIKIPLSIASRDGRRFHQKMVSKERNNNPAGRAQASGSLKRRIPNDRDFLFEAVDKRASTMFYAGIVDCNTTAIIARNDSDCCPTKASRRRSCEGRYTANFQATTMSFHQGRALHKLHPWTSQPRI